MENPDLVFQETGSRPTYSCLNYVPSGDTLRRDEISSCSILSTLSTSVCLTNIHLLCNLYPWINYHKYSRILFQLKLPYFNFRQWDSAVQPQNLIIYFLCHGPQTNTCCQLHNLLGNRGWPHLSFQMDRSNGTYICLI